MGLTYADLKLTSLIQKKSLNIRSLVDTGATFMCVTQAMAVQLGFDTEEVRTQTVTLADGSQKKVPKIAPIEIEFETATGLRSYVTEALVLGDEPLLGVLPLEAMDLIVDPRAQKLLPNPANPNVPVALAK